MKKICTLLLLLVLIIIKLPAKCQNSSFDPKNNEEKIYLLFSPIDELSPRFTFIVFKKDTILSELILICPLITNDSVFISIEESKKGIDILQSYGEKLIWKIIEKQIPLYIKINFKNNNLGFKKVFLRPIIEEVSEPILLMPANYF